ncbi:acetate--CoA ligase family protein [Tepidibacter aestuarii]|uniref:acetate--CoA ligase family protein n=1 Tax=Tepidibacter aestuarii TaxID=2925782 RepID=UPI0020BD6BDA|nr:acetate--CoA ligase family protein [Tepidibacter aestuarii]CAH2213800.1 acetate---CoA ligase (ADP-forming) [Tepidibacter aestuarii]
MDISKLLNPRNICVIGASEKEGFGGDTCRNILSYMDISRVFFVNPNRDKVFDIPCYKSISDIQDTIDLVIICTPKATVNFMLVEAAKKGAKGTVVYASGYSELGTKEGIESEMELKALCEKLDIALMGPNCAGFVNYVSDVQAFAFISDKHDRKGSVGVISQSGQICLSLMDSPSMKFSYNISAGNSSIVTVEDYLDYLIDDDDTKVVAMYLEGIKNPKRFEVSLKKAAIKRKPIVILKVGKSEKGGNIASSHTGSLAGADKVYNAVFKKFGVIRVDDIEELLATSLMLSILPKYPDKATFASMNLSGGETGVCADLGHLNGVEFPDFDESTINKLNKILPSYATPNNPLDMTASLSYDSELYASALRTVMSDPNVGLVAIGYTLLREIADPAIHYMAEGIEIVVKEGNSKPVVMIPFVEHTRNIEYSEKLAKIGVPVMPPAGYAFKILKYLADFVNYNPENVDLSLSIPDMKNNEFEAISEYESKKMLKEYDIPVPNEVVAENVEDAARFAEKIGYPVVMKIDSVDILHKSDIGGVKLNIQNKEEVREAFHGILKNAKTYMPSARIGGVLIQQMANKGLEVIVGVNNDPQFGPCVLCGLGGVFVEVFKDTVICPAPVSKKEAIEMVNSLKGSKLLKGYRGNPPLDVNALSDVIVNISKFACDNKDNIKELDINPIFIYEKGLSAVDALVIKNKI